MTDEKRGEGRMASGGRKEPEKMLAPRDRSAGYIVPLLDGEAGDEEKETDASGDGEWATKCSDGLYRGSASCYCFFPYRHPCARRLGL
jgi:hypothetical protein